MSRSIIRKCLESRLSLMPSIATAWENAPFTPVNGVPYQRVSILFNTPRDRTIGLDMVEEKGFLSIQLAYPSGNGPRDAEARADAIKAHFQPPLTLTDSGVEVRILAATYAKDGRTEDDRYCIPILIPWKAFLTRT